MACKLKIFSIYKLQNEERYYLLRTERPEFSNTSQNEEDLAIETEQQKRAYILQQITETYGHKEAVFDFIGEFQDYPIGDDLYSEQGNVELNIYYIETDYQHPWIILGSANSETDFLSELYADEDLLELKPIGKPRQIKVVFVTENNF